LKTADVVSANNPYITDAVIAEFRRLARDADGRRSGGDHGIPDVDVTEGDLAVDHDLDDNDSD
jgi:hypothetical protein